MSRVKKSFLVFVLLFSLVACSQAPLVPPTTPTFTPYAGGTETALASLTPTPWLAGAETALAGPLPTSTVEEENPPAPSALPTFPPPTTQAAALSPLTEGTFSPILYAARNSGAFLLVGGFMEDRGWLSGLDASAYVSSETKYDFFNPRASIQIGGAVFEFSPTCRNSFMLSSTVLPDRMVGVASDWLTEKRLTRELSTDDPSYIEAVREWFQSQGNSPAEIQINRILQVDIEGDDTNEILISAAYFKDTSGHMTETGDYSVVLMRKVIGDQVHTVPLVQDYYISSVPAVELSYPNTYTLVDALDLNRDGTLEVIVGVSRWEGGGAIVFRVDSQNVREVMRTIC